MGVYTLGKNQFALSYEMSDADADDSDKETVTIQALHNLSDNMYVYVEGYLAGGDQVYDFTTTNSAGTEVTASTDEKTLAAVGAVYYF